MFAVGSKLGSLSQINRALKAGLTIEAELFWQDEFTPSKQLVEPSSVIAKMVDLRVSAYRQLVGIEDKNADDFDVWSPDTMYNSWWEFTIVEQ